ncbi:hypothetical protein TRSC58_07634 [Trypanosoma rangeli SC58]|uniref:Uncharacterized protein n=1 Tax=Trypanosoma rangeli SC58 TaxID=429131 RepID=A0A061IRR6_TRYRA|nr:hypothetical protein TRSC58_07634 [Trypanosoma rangeli SC58]
MAHPRNSRKARASACVHAFAVETAERQVVDRERHTDTEKEGEAHTHTHRVHACMLQQRPPPRQSPHRRRAGKHICIFNKAKQWKKFAVVVKASGVGRKKKGVR